MTLKFETERQLRQCLQQPGNWRFKGLMLAAMPGFSQEDVGDAWPAGKRGRRYLSQAHRDTKYDTGVRYIPPEERSDGSKPTVRKLAEDEAGDERQLNDKGVDKDLLIKRALLNESITELDVLYREELRDTVIDGAQPLQVAREVSDVINVDTRKGDLPRGSSQLYASKVAEGSEIPRDEENFDTVAFTCEKYGQGFEVTDELIDQGLVDVIERNVRFTGAAIENALNRVFLNELLDNVQTSNTHDTGQSAATADDLNQAAQRIELNEFGTADSAVVNPKFKTDLFSDTNLVYANRAGTNEMLNQRVFRNEIFGMDIATMSDSTYNGSNTWDWNTDGDIGAVVYNSDFVSIQIYRDIETKDFEDPIRDIQGGNARAQFDANWLQSGAGIRVTY